MTNYLHHVLLRLRSRGLIPTGFIDVGAHFGETNNVIKSVFPEKRVFSFEANPNCGEALTKNGAEHLICLLGKEYNPAVAFFLNPDDLTSTGCSIYKEKSHFFANPTKVNLPMYRLDQVVPTEAKLNFLKMDVQGAELDVLDGATGLLPTIKWIYLEVSFISLNEGSPLFGEVFDYLRDRGYRISDMCDPTWIDNELVQCNFLFEQTP